MEKVLIDGEMVECLLDNIKMIEKVALEFTYGLMEEHIMEIGKEENKTVLDFILFQTRKILMILKSKKEHGKMVNVKNGVRISLKKK
jgi:hypothetical protein